MQTPLRIIEPGSPSSNSKSNKQFPPPKATCGDCSRGGMCRVNGQTAFGCRHSLFAALRPITKLPSAGFSGVLCEENIDNCDPDPCHHGQCQDGIDSYTCICNPGYMGAICSDQIDECYSSPCLNDGRCIDLVNGYQCNCQPGTSGRTVPSSFPPTFHLLPSLLPCHPLGSLASSV